MKHFFFIALNLLTTLAFTQIDPDICYGSESYEETPLEYEWGKVYNDPDVLAVFKGGESSFKEFFYKHLDQSKAEFKARAIIVIVVSYKGEVKDVIIERGFSPRVDKEVKRVARLSKWSPGLVDCLPVDSKILIKYSIPEGYSPYK